MTAAFVILAIAAVLCICIMWGIIEQYSGEIQDLEAELAAAESYCRHALAEAAALRVRCSADDLDNLTDEELIGEGLRLLAEREAQE